MRNTDILKPNKEPNKFNQAEIQPRTKFLTTTVHQQHGNIQNSNHINNFENSPSHKNPDRLAPSDSCQHNAVETTSENKVAYTEEMIREQEALVKSMSQQGIPAALIKRQFDRLLEEQKKQLRLFVDAKKTNNNNNNTNNNKKEGFDGNERGRRSCVEDEPSGRSTSTEKSKDTTPVQKLEPSSLLKIRMAKEALDTRKRNNGLQEATSAREIMKMFSRGKYGAPAAAKPFSSTCGLENDTREKSEPINQETTPGPNVSNENHVTASPGSDGRLIPGSTQGYPYDCVDGCGSNDRNRKAIATDETSEVNCGCARTGLVRRPVDPESPGFTYWPDLQEPRIIGGVTYLARKIAYGTPNVPGF